MSTTKQIDPLKPQDPGKRVPPSMKERLTTDREKAEFAAKRKHLGVVVDTDVGMKFGPNSEFTLVFDVMPGHGKQLREDGQPGRRRLEAVLLRQVAQTQAAARRDLPFVRLLDSGQHAQQRGLARAVGTD